MSVLRFDPSTADWVVFAPSRALRHHDVRTAADVSASGAHGSCPFCPGNESLTPPEIAAVRPPGAGVSGWQVRVVPNKFPALRIEDDLRRREETPGFQCMGGCGAHEVVIESPEHESRLARLPLEQVERVLTAVQDRHRDLMRDHRFQAIIAFKNHGTAAGTSLAHPHWQVIATPVVPRVLRLKHFVAAEHFDRTGECLYCGMLERELSARRRVLCGNDEFTAILPYASHVPFETWIVPRRHQPSFDAAESVQLRALAEILRRVLLKLHTALDDPAYNLTIDSAPRGDEDKEYFLWHVRILPRLTTPAGFELGSGMSINTVLPEDATAFLSEAATADNGQPALGAVAAAP
jgi:UDPglucose--hexose-1-phosphate uridylyltransferase